MERYGTGLKSPLVRILATTKKKIKGMKNSVIKLALKGMESNVLVENLLAMNPEYWLIDGYQQ
jgi:hypothetical protein